MVDSKMPMSRSILWILLSTLFISGSAFMAWLYYLHVRELRLHDDQYRIVALVQNTPQADALKTVYLAELLDLSLDRPVNLYQFNIQESVKILLNHPLIKEASIKKILPGTLYIDYSIRTPLAFVGDFANTAIDEEGHLFPFRPFFTPKRLPTIYLGLNTDECKWGSCLKSLTSVQVAFDLLRQFECIGLEGMYLKQLDVTQFQADSYGKRQIVMTLKKISENKNLNNSNALIILRLSLDHTKQDLINFRSLQATLSEKKEELLEKGQSVIIDFRIPHLAFIRAGQ